MRLLKFVAYLAVALGILWTAAWHLVEPVAEWRAASAFERMAERGIDATIDDIEVSGFPTAFDVTLHGVSLRDENRRVAVQIPRVEAAYSLGAPMRAQLRLPEPIQALRGHDAARTDVVVAFDGFVGAVRRERPGVYVAEAAADAVSVDVSDAANRRVVNARIDGFAAEATLDEEQRRAAARFSTPSVTILDAVDEQTPAQTEIVAVLSELTAEMAGVTLETTVERVAVTDADPAAAAAPALLLAAFAAPPASDAAPAAPDAATAAPGAGRDGALRALAAEMFGGGGALTSRSTVGRIEVRRTLPETARPLRRYAFAAPDAVSEIVVTQDAARHQTTIGEITLRTTSVAEDGSEFIGLDGAVAGATMSAESPLEPGAATALVSVDAGPITFSEETIARAYGEDAPVLAEPQGLRLSAEAALSIADNPLLRALGAGTGAPGPAVELDEARLVALRAAALDFELTADGALQSEAAGPIGEATLILRNYRPFLQRVATLGLFDRALINVMSLSIGAFAQRSETDATVGTVALQRLPSGELVVNGRRMRLPGG